MRSVRGRVAAAALAAAFAVAPSADSREGPDHPASWDLLCKDIRVGGRGDWASWWAVNRAAVLKPSYRASAGADGAAPPIDAAARSRARDALLAELKSKERLVSSEAALALGRAGDARDIAVLARIVADGKAADARRLHNLAAVGLGLLPAGDAAQSAEARRALLAGLSSARGEEDRYLYFWTGCAYALAMRGDAAAVPRLVELRKDARSGGAAAGRTLDGEVLGAICRALAALGADEALSEAREQLLGRKSPGSGAKDNSWAACHALACIPGADARKLLRAGAREDRESVRRVALGALADEKDDETAELLRSVMTRDRDPACRQAASIALGRAAHASSAGTLMKWLATRVSSRDLSNLDVLADRGAVALALGLHARVKPDAKISAALARELAESKSQDDQAALALACGLAGVQAARGRVAELVSKGKGDVLAPTAAFALGLLGAGPEERKVLHEAVAQTVFADIRGAAARALGMLRDRTVVDRLRAIVQSKSTRDVDRSTAAVCLGVVGDDADADFLIAAIGTAGSDEQVRACMVHALGRLLDRSENAALGRVAADSKWVHEPGGAMPDAILDVQYLAD